MTASFILLRILKHPSFQLCTDEGNNKRYKFIANLIVRRLNCLNRIKISTEITNINLEIKVRD